MYAFVFAAGAFALLFMGLALRGAPRAAKLLAAVLWGAYAVYEYYVANGTLCDANCNIRVDLLLFLPLLGVATYLGLQKAPRAGAVALLYVISAGLVAALAAAFGNTMLAAAAGVATVVAAVVGFRVAFAGKRA